MKNAIICSDRPVTLVGGGVPGPEDLALALARAPRLVAADGGATYALAAGHLPEAVIGDMDSLTAQDRARLPPERIFRIDEQESTDFDKALRSIGAPMVLAIGFLGGRMDHQLSVLNSLARYPERRCIGVGAHEVIFHLPRMMDLPLQRGDVVSLVPMRPVTGRSRGLDWPLDGLHFAPDGRIGTSNRATGAVSLAMDGPGMLALVPRRALDAVMRAFAPGPAAPDGP